MGKDFGFTQQAEFQDYEKHKILFNEFFNKLGFQIIHLSEISSLNIPFADIIYLLKKKGHFMHGFIECKDDQYEISRSPNMVSELVSYINPRHLNGVKLYQRCSSNTHPEDYSRICNLVDNVLEQKIEASIGFGLNRWINEYHLLSYNYSKSNVCYFWYAKMVKEYTIKCFKNKSNDIIATQSHRNGRIWNTISILINRDELKDFMVGEHKY